MTKVSDERLKGFRNWAADPKAPGNIFKEEVLDLLDDLDEMKKASERWQREAAFNLSLANKRLVERVHALLAKPAPKAVLQRKCDKAYGAGAYNNGWKDGIAAYRGSLKRTADSVEE